MSHPGAISCRCNLTISRRRRRIRLRRTALPSAFFMLQPKRLLARPLGRRNSVNSRLLRRRPSRYTASYSARRTRRKARGKSSRVATSDAREAVAPFFAASCKNFPSTLRFHALAKAVLFMSAPHMRLKSAFRQRSSPSQFIAARALLPIAGPVETSSLDDPRATVKEPRRRVVGPFQTWVYCVPARFWQYGNMGNKNARKREIRKPKKEKPAPKPDMNQIAARIVKETISRSS